MVEELQSGKACCLFATKERLPAGSSLCRSREDLASNPVHQLFEYLFPEIAEKVARPTISQLRDSALFSAQSALSTPTVHGVSAKLIVCVLMVASLSAGCAKTSSNLQPNESLMDQSSTSALRTTESSKDIFQDDKTESSTPFTENQMSPTGQPVVVINRCWKGSTSSGTYEIRWPEFADPRFELLQAVIDGEALARLAQLYFWEEANNDMAHTAMVVFANNNLVSIRSQTSYYAVTTPHPQDEQASYLWNVKNKVRIEPFDPASIAQSLFQNEEAFLAFYDYASEIAARHFGLNDTEEFTRFSPMQAVIVASDGLIASWDRTGALPSFETSLSWDQLANLDPFVLENLNDQRSPSNEANCVQAPIDELFHG